MKGIWTVIGRTFSDWYADRAPRLGAALAYYTVFALAPSLVIVIGVAGLVLGRESAQGQILEQIRDLVGEQGAQAVEAAIKSAQNPKASVTAIGVGLLTLVFGLWGVFGELQDALNTIWGVAAKPGRGILGMLKDRLLSFALVVGVGFVLLVSLALSAWLAMLGAYFGHLMPLPTMALEGINFAISFAVITGLFALTFKLLPDVKIAWRDVWLGAAVTSLLFTVGKLLIGLYLGTSGVASVFGAAGSLVVILVWVYYSAQILYLGAEFTKVWARWRGGGFVPDKTAVPMTAEARAEQGMGRKARRRRR
jgi:membrane protein